MEKKEEQTPYWEGKHYSFFQNTQCEFFPCHQIPEPENFNCLFCYCPLFALGEACGGDFSYNQHGNKDCSLCLLPHQRKNYGFVVDQYPKLKKLAEKKK